MGLAIGADKDGAGISVFANASTAKGNSNGNGITHAETTLQAGNILTMSSGRDTTLKGAIVSGNTVIADIGRNLSLESEQDSDTYKAKQSSAGGGISYTFGAGGVGGSLSLSKSNTNSNFNSVNEQTAIKAGDGGFTINVDGNTHLKGAVIDSTLAAQVAGNNQLTTGTLTTSDIENQGSYTANSSNLGLNLSGNINTGVNNPAGGTAGSTLKAGLGGLGGSDSGEAHGTSKSAIATADITITDNAAQINKTGNTAAQTVTNLNRDTQHANGNISNPFDLQKVNEQLEFLQVAGEEVLQPAAAQAAKWIGDTFTPDPAHPDQIDPAKVLAHAVLGAAMSQLLGSGWQTGAGALGDVLPQVLAKAFEKDEKGQIKDPEAFKAANVIISTVLESAAGGDLASTINAGMITPNAVANNYLKHQEISRYWNAVAACSKGNNTACQQRDALKAESDKRDAKLANCESQSSATCNNLRQEVRNAEAEIIRNGGYGFDGNLASLGTQIQADKTFVSVLDTSEGVLQGGVHSIIDGISSLANGVKTVLIAAYGRQDSPAQQKALQDVIDTGASLAALVDPEVLAQVINGATAAQREQIAAAYENGDSIALGRVSGAVLSNLVGVGTIKNVGKVADAVKVAETIAAKDLELANNLLQRSDIMQVKQVSAGSKSNWDKSINSNLEANTAYVLDNGHAYITDAGGRVKEVTGDLNLTAMDRNLYQQCTTGKCGNAGDEGGHLIASSLGGAGDKINIVPQAAILNRGPWKAMENELRSALDAGKEVKVKIDIGYPTGGGSRPSEFIVTAVIDGKPMPRKIFNQ